PSQPGARGSCLIHNWQEERATRELDRVPRPELGSEGYFYRHGHRGLLSHQLPSRPAGSTTTMKDAYREPWRTARPARGEAALPAGTASPCRKEVLEETCPPPAPMESRSTTHRDYRAEGFQPAPPPPTQARLPHDLYAEQPHSYWLEHARGVPVSPRRAAARAPLPRALLTTTRPLPRQGVTSICTTDTPFRRNAAFSTPVTEQLGQPLP
ncbi:SPAG8 protein, partial [Nothocercus julius]|nr:SPAG8 protein [Nothocercus julius]